MGVPAGSANEVTGVGFYLQFTFLLPLFLTIVGWIVVAYQGDLRERRRDIREHIGDARAQCSKIAESAAVYWITFSDRTNRAVAAIELKAEIESLGRTLRVLVEAGLDFDRWDYLSDLRQAATGADFEVKGRKRRDADREKLPEIRAISDDLLAELQQSFYRQNPIHNPLRMLRWVAIGVVVLGIIADSHAR